MEFIFETLKQIRSNALKSIEGYSIEQLNKIPEGFGNNISWNLGHMVATQQILCYKLSGASLLLPEDFISLYKKDSSPKTWSKPASIEEIKKYFTLTNEAFALDYSKKIFANYKPYTTSAGVTLNTIEDALIYNYGHENLHYGVILTLKKLVLI